MSKEKFVNPFKKGDLHNPAVSLGNLVKEVLIKLNV